MSDNNWKFDPSDLADTDNSTETETDSNVTSSLSPAALVLLPLSVIAVYAVVAKATVLGAIEAIIGAGGLALAITNAFWVVGLIVVGIYAVLLGVGVLSLLAAVVKRSAANLVIALLIGAYYGAGWAVATYLFSGLPLLVGFTLASSLLFYGGVVVLIAVVGIGVVALA